jgi:hypothetical protein
MDFHAAGIEMRQQVHEQPTAPMQAAVVADVIDEPQHVERALPARGRRTGLGIGIAHVCHAHATHLSNAPADEFARVPHRN